MLYLRGFTDMGYTRFSRSLMRFCRMSGPSAKKLTTGLRQMIAANLQEQGQDGPERCEPGRPYHTEVQFYKAAYALQRVLPDGACAVQQCNLHQMLRLVLYDVAFYFRTAYGMEIEDPRTVYALCKARLETGEGEHSGCLLKDWEQLSCGSGGKAPKTGCLRGSGKGKVHG